MKASNLPHGDGEILIKVRGLDPILIVKFSIHP